MHPAHRDPHHQPQALNAEMFGDQAVFQFDEVAVAVARKPGAQAVTGLGGFPGAQDVGEDQKVAGGIERAAAAVSGPIIDGASTCDASPLEPCMISTPLTMRWLLS